MTRNQHEPHIGIASVASAFMAIALAAGLGFMKIMDRLDGFIEALLTRPGLSAASHSIPPWVLWIGTATLSIFLAGVMLNVAGTWRRLLIWGLTLALTLFWGPVLVIADFKPDIGVAIVAVLWSGFCAMIYATNHQLPADRLENPEMKTNNGAR